MTDYSSMPDDQLLAALKKEKRNEAEYATKQMAYKILLNSCYGAIGQQYFRFFDIRQAEAITLSGQLSIKWIEKFLNDYLNEVCETEGETYAIYMDTDSCYISLEKLIDKIGIDKTKTKKVIDFMDAACKKINIEIDGEYTRLSEYVNAFNQTMVMEREALADRGFWTRKKRYALNVHNSEGVSFDPPHLKIMGLETARSSTPEVCRDSLEESIKLILTTDEDTVIDYIKKFRSKFMNMNAEEIASTSGISDINKYQIKGGYSKGTPIHVRAAILHNMWVKGNNMLGKYELIRSGDKIKYVYLKEPNPVKENVFGFSGIPPKELEIEKYIDYTKQYEKTFLAPLKTILNCIGWEHERTQTLEDFFV